MFAKCVNDPQVLEHSQKCFVRIKTAKKLQQSVTKTEQKTEKNSNNNHEKRKIN